MWIGIKAWFKNSLTILWARFLALAGILSATAVALSADPAASGAIQGVLGPYGPYYLIAIGLITELCRRRTVGEATDANNQVR